MKAPEICNSNKKRLQCKKNFAVYPSLSKFGKVHRKTHVPVSLF